MELNATAAFSTRNQDEAKADQQLGEGKNLEKTFFCLKPSNRALPSTILEQLPRTDTFAANHNSSGEESKINPSLKIKTFRQIHTYSRGKVIQNVKSLAFTVPSKDRLLFLLYA